jgi:hypothetical protein
VICDDLKEKMDSDIHMYVTSESSKDIFKNNTNSSFRVKLPYNIVLSDDHEIAIKEMMLPSLFDENFKFETQVWSLKNNQFFSIEEMSFEWANDDVKNFVSIPKELTRRVNLKINQNTQQANIKMRKWLKSDYDENKKFKSLDIFYPSLKYPIISYDENTRKMSIKEGRLRARFVPKDVDGKIIPGAEFFEEFSIFLIIPSSLIKSIGIKTNINLRGKIGQVYETINSISQYSDDRLIYITCDMVL